MAVASVTIPTLLGNIQIYTDSRKLEKANKIVKETPNILTEAYYVSARKYAERIAKMARTCLSRGMPPRGSGVSWPPHAESTVKRLGEHGLLYWSSQYYHYIRVLKRGKHIAVGLPSNVKKTRPDRYNPKNPLTLTKVAKLLELGSEDGKIPARPLWAYLWPAVGGNNSYKKLLVEQIRKQLRNII